MVFIRMTIFLLLFYFVINKSTLSSTITIIDEFHEELVLRPLDGDHVYAYFQFSTVWNKTLENNIFKHSHLFPRSLGELIERYDVGELHISMTQGTWRHKAWGYPIVESSLGAELWAWFLNGTTDVDKKWRELTNSLSGLLGCSLNFVDNVNSVSPMLSFRPLMFNGIRNTTRVEPFSLRYANLPREIVCTENLTPWKKLLPCDGYMGLASLLNARYMHNSNYHSISLSYKPTCLDDKCRETGVKVVQTISLVYDVLLLKGSVKSWSIRKLYGSGLSGPCPITMSALLYVDITLNNKGNVFDLSITPDEVIEENYGDNPMILAMYNVTHVKPKRMFNMIATYHSNSPHLIPTIYSPILWTERYIKGYGRDESLLITKIYNNSSRPLTIIYLENLPWYIPVYYHTLKITSNSEIIQPSKKHYYPGKSRRRPYYLEVMFDIRANSLTEITIEFDYVFLKWQEYPPDANHGFYVGSGVLSIFPHFSTNETHCFLLNDRWKSISDNGCILRLRTVPLIINLPTPDFSMPYNVICLACTVVALAFGPLHNITTKRLHKTQVGKKRGLVKLVTMLWGLIKGLSKRNK